MYHYIIDENLPSTVPSWNVANFIHVLKINNQFSDGEIWNYALAKDLIIITKDVDFYNRYLSSFNCPKVIWIRTGNMRKRDFYKFVEQFWPLIEKMIESCYFLIVTEDKFECL